MIKPKNRRQAMKFILICKCDRCGKGATVENDHSNWNVEYLARNEAGMFLDADMHLCQECKIDIDLLRDQQRVAMQNFLEMKEVEDNG
jgi:tRNA 2-selenouridine synthase SelU